METNDNKDLGDKKINNQQKENTEKELNEGFSGENIPDNYNPSEEKIENRLKHETETDQNGDSSNPKRSRYPDDGASETVNSKEDDGGNSEIKNEKSLENRDRNYDSEPNRYPASHPENQEDRGNIKLDEE